MANLKDLLVNGVARVIGKVYASEFVGKLTGSATTLATSRTIDGVSFNGSADITHYGTCSDTAGTVAKTVTCDGFTLVKGAKIAVKFTVTNTASNPTLNVNNTGAKAIYYRGSAISAGYLASGRTYEFVYNGTQYELIGDLDTNTTYSVFGKSGSTASTGLVPKPSTTAGSSKYLREDGNWATPTDTNTIPQGYCSTSASTAAKVASCSGYALTAKTYLMVILTTANNAQGALTLNVNGTGAKPIYINGTASSSTNYTLPAGSYLTYYDGTNYYFRTDGKITGNITGSADITHYGSCSDTAGTVAKTVACSGFTLATGAKIAVKFTVTNTASNPTLNVNNTGAKAIYYRGSAISAGYLASGRTYEFVYNGTQYELIGDLDTNTTYSVFGKSGSTASTGLVPAPSTTAGTSKYLREDGSWVTPPDTNTTYSNATSSSAGLMGADDKAKLDGIATNANNYSHPTYTSKTSGLYKITVDGTGHVSATTAVTKADITGLGIPDSDTKVTSTVGNTTKAYLVGSTSSSEATSTLIKDTNVYLDTTAGKLVATTFSGTELISSSSSFPYGKVKIGVDGESGFVEISNNDLKVNGNTAHLDMWQNKFRIIKNNSDGKTYIPLQVENEQVVCSKVTGAVWNDLADSISVDDDCNLEHGYCYCFDGEKYTKSSKYLDDGIIGIHSDTYGFKMGNEEGKKKMDVAVSGFVLAYVDKEYKPGTPLTCTENGYLTEIKKEDKIEYPEKIVATYWKDEPSEEWGSDDKKVKVNGRKWVKIK